VLLTGCGNSTHPVPYTDLTKEMGSLAFTRITRDVFRDRASLVEVLERNNPGRRIDLPQIDFARQEVYLVAAGPRSSTGYDLRVVRVEDQSERVVVVVHEQTPSLGDPVEARVTYPFRLIALPRSDKPVKLKWLGRP
jgi:hypothetical protein